MRPCGRSEHDPAAWVIPWAVIAEIDYRLQTHLGVRMALQFMKDVSDGRWIVDWDGSADLERTHALCRQYAFLNLGLVDAVVIATAERLRASEVATLDLRDFGAVEIAGRPPIIPRDL